VDDRPGRLGAAGGILGRGWIETLAVAAMVGVAPESIVRADPLERELLIDVAEVGIRLQTDRDEALARRIIGTLAEALKRGRR
jgi:hypothetical protein